MRYSRKKILLEHSYFIKSWSFWMFGFRGWNKWWVLQIKSENVHNKNRSLWIKWLFLFVWIQCARGWKDATSVTIKPSMKRSLASKDKTIISPKDRLICLFFNINSSWKPLTWSGQIWTRCCSSYLIIVLQV